MTTPRFVAERTPGGTPSSPRWSADRAADGAAYAQGARAGHWTSNSAPSTTSDGPAWRAVPYLEVRSGRRSRSTTKGGGSSCPSSPDRHYPVRRRLSPGSRDTQITIAGNLVDDPALEFTAVPTRGLAAAPAATPTNRPSDAVPASSFVPWIRILSLRMTGTSKTTSSR